jgi:hypothetical protein
MSTMSNPIRSRSLLPVGLPRPRLTIVPRMASRAPRVPFVILVVLVLGGGLIGLLLLNTALQRGAYEISDLRTRSDSLAAQQQTLEMQVAELRQPHRVAEAALTLGMVRNDSPAFLDLTTGAVTGAAKPALESNVPVLGVKPGLANPGVAKVHPLVAGDSASEAEFVQVPRVTQQSSATTAEEQAPANSTADTQQSSGDREPPRVTNNSSNTR